jgi:hypothetical protein
MRKILLLSFLISFNAFSSLAPFYHSVKEYEDLLNDPRLVSILGVGRFIQEIKKDGETITINTRECSLLVKSTLTNQEMPGAPKFKFDFGKLACK